MISPLLTIYITSTRSRTRAPHFAQFYVQFCTFKSSILYVFGFLFSCMYYVWKLIQMNKNETKKFMQTIKYVIDVL